MTKKMMIKLHRQQVRQEREVAKHHPWWYVLIKKRGIRLKSDSIYIGGIRGVSTMTTTTNTRGVVV